MNPGTIIILNGASSSGKTTTLKAVQAQFKEPFLDAGLDRFLWMLPGRYLERPLWDDVLGLATEAGETGHRLVLGMHRAMAELAYAGNNVIADHVLVELSWVNDCARVLADLPAWLIGVRCPLDVLETRESERGDRTLGQARAQAEIVHRYCLYDFEIDTSILTPAECAAQIRNHIRWNSPTALRELRLRTQGS